MAWSSQDTSDALSLSGTFQDFAISATPIEVTLNPGERAHVQFSYNPQGSPTEHLEWQILATLDGSVYDTTPLHVGSVDKDLADPNQISLIVEGVWGFKAQGRLVDPDGAAGGTDTATATFSYRKDGVSL